MSGENNNKEQRELLRVAEMLRSYILETSDTHYIELFLVAASALEARARQIAEDARIGRHLDLRC